LAINDRPELENYIVAVVLAMAEVKRIDTLITKCEKPKTQQERTRLEGLVAQIEYFETKLAAAKMVLAESGGRVAEKYVDHRRQRRGAFEQLEQVKKWAEQEFGKANVNLSDLLPSISDYLKLQE
jgi:phosphoenolpyruvate carboxylase